jgi:hypothetical protein
MKNLYMAALLYTVATVAWSSPGAIDQYGCHRDSANVYHCHGDFKQAKRIHTLIGVGAKSTTWFYSDGPANFFIGPSLEAELAFDALAVRAGWTYQPLLFAASNYSLSGWDIGVKLGKGLSRIGNHGFLELGYFHNQFNQANGNVNLLNGYQLGVGFILNKENWSFDGKFMFRDATDLRDYWNNEVNIPTEVADYSFSLGVYRRF